MGVIEAIAEQPAASIEAFDWPDFRLRLPAAVEGQTPQVRRRMISLGGDLHCSVTFEDRDERPPAEEGEVATAVSLGQTRTSLRCPADLVELLVRARGFTQDCHNLSASALSMIAEHLLSAAAKPLEARFGGDVRHQRPWNSLA